MESRVGKHKASIAPPANLLAAACFAFVSGIVVNQGGIVGVTALGVAVSGLIFYRHHGCSYAWCALLAVVFISGILRAQASVLPVSFPDWVESFLTWLHTGIAAPFERLFLADEASLATGLVIGVDATFSSSLKSAMRASGTTHLVALSGYNVSIIIASALALFSRFMRRRTASWLAAGGIIFFTLIAGTQPSLVRAAIMGVVGLFAYESGRIYNVGHAILYTATGMLCADPALIASLGAQLSFVSVLGLVYVEPFLPFRDFHAPRWIEVVMEQARTTVAAQAAVLPLLLLAFGSVNALAVVANTLILPFVPFAMLLAVITSLTAIFLPILAFLPATFLELFLMYMVKVIYLFSHIVIPLRWRMTSLEAVVVMLTTAVAIGYAQRNSRQTDHR